MWGFPDPEMVVRAWGLVKPISPLWEHGAQ